MKPWARRWLDTGRAGRSLFVAALSLGRENSRLFKALGASTSSAGGLGVERDGTAIRLPKPALRWVGPEAEIALRAFDWGHDSDQVCAWQSETYAANFPSHRLTPEFVSCFAHDLRRAAGDAQHGLWVLDEASRGGPTCGFLWAVICLNSWTNERYGYINTIYVSPHRRGQSLGAELLEQARSWCQERGVSRLRLTVTASNERALALYQRAGYTIERHEMERDTRQNS